LESIISKDGDNAHFFLDELPLHKFKYLDFDIGTSSVCALAEKIGDDGYLWIACRNQYNYFESDMTAFRQHSICLYPYVLRMLLL
jgi:hypothetical protein